MTIDRKNIDHCNKIYVKLYKFCNSEVCSPYVWRSDLYFPTGTTLVWLGKCLISWHFEKKPLLLETNTIFFAMHAWNIKMYYDAVSSLFCKFELSNTVFKKTLMTNLNKGPWTISNKCIWKSLSLKHILCHLSLPAVKYWTLDGVWV